MPQHPTESASAGGADSHPRSALSFAAADHVHSSTEVGVNHASSSLMQSSNLPPSWPSILRRTLNDTAKTDSPGVSIKEERSAGFGEHSNSSFGSAGSSGRAFGQIIAGVGAYFHKKTDEGCIRYPCCQQTVLQRREMMDALLL
jgi:hypothetical protein